MLRIHYRSNLLTVGKIEPENLTFCLDVDVLKEVMYREVTLIIMRNMVALLCRYHS